MHLKLVLFFYKTLYHHEKPQMPIFNKTNLPTDYRKTNYRVVINSYFHSNHIPDGFVDIESTASFGI